MAVCCIKEKLLHLQFPKEGKKCHSVINHLSFCCIINKKEVNLQPWIVQKILLKKKRGLGVHDLQKNQSCNFGARVLKDMTWQFQNANHETRRGLEFLLFLVYPFKTLL